MLLFIILSIISQILVPGAGVGRLAWEIGELVFEAEGSIFFYPANLQDFSPFGRTSLWYVSLPFKSLQGFNSGCNPSSGVQ